MALYICELMHFTSLDNNDNTTFYMGETFISSILRNRESSTGATDDKKMVTSLFKPTTIRLQAHVLTHQATSTLPSDNANSALHRIYAYLMMSWLEQHPC